MCKPENKYIYRDDQTYNLINFYDKNQIVYCLHDDKT